VLIWLLLFPRELVGLLYGAGERWAETAAILPWLAVFGFLYPIADNVKVLLIGIGRIRDAMKFRVVQLCVTLPLLIPAILHWGARGAAAVMALSEVVGLGSSYRSLRDEIGTLALGGYLRPAIAAAVGGGVVVASRHWHVLPWTGRTGFAANLAASGVLYVVCLAIFDWQQMQELVLALVAAFQGETPMVQNAAEVAAGDGPAGLDDR
jgi:O-antigen/teichoic acid export membrane protein